MKQYKVKLNGLTPLLMHQDNLAFSEKVKKWQKDPANKELSIAGDDRSPAWTWLGYCYHNNRVLGLPSDNLMTMLREGGCKVVNKGKETYKKQTQAGILIDQEQWDLYLGEKTVPVSELNALVGKTDFNAHLDVAEKYGFELNVKRAKIGAAKHVRVRPMFREWAVVGSLTVIDEELSGLTEQVAGLGAARLGMARIMAWLGEARQG
jgi:hypothetical protein